MSQQDSQTELAKALRAVSPLHEAAWPDMFANLQAAYAELTQSQFELENRTLEIREFNDLFERVIESMSEALFLLDRTGRIVRVNRSTGTMLELAESDLVGRHLAELLPSDTIPTTPWELLALAPSGVLTNLDSELLTTTGRQVPVSLSCGIVRDKRGKITGVLIVARDITSRRQAEERIKASLKEKEVLLKEIHHRVKNNLQVVSSLLRLQSEYVKEEATLQALHNSQNRIHSMALVHEKLYRSQDLASIDFADYVHDLLRNLLHSYEVYTDSILLTLKVDSVSLTVDAAIPCGLIINELVSNALKYAFPQLRQSMEATRSGADMPADVPPEIRIELHVSDDAQLRLTVADNGIGFPQQMDFRDTESLGLQLVTLLVAQLGGTIELQREAGTTFHITFSQPQYRERV